MAARPGINERFARALTRQLRPPLVAEPAIPVADDRCSNLFSIMMTSNVSIAP
jgi:hypothetical protein